MTARNMTRIAGQLAIVASLGALLGCAGPYASVKLADDNANDQTRALFANLQALSDEAVLFGHHDDLAYGVYWRNEPGRSDVREASGSYPALYGWDASRLLSPWGGDSARIARTDQLRKWILEGYRRGGVIAMCWHMWNPVTNRVFYDTTRAVHEIIPGGSLHEQYKTDLDVLADFLLSLETGSVRVPVIFRPFHEHNGSWFWWGRRHSTIDDFVALWRFTVEYLRDVRGVDNVLYAYSTDVFDSKEAYLERYPGDDYIDILGYDDYKNVRTDSTRADFARCLRMLVEMAETRGKIAALTETGVESVPDSTWWTDVLLEGITADSVGRRIAFVMVWRNENHDRMPGHFYAPYDGHPSEVNFVVFRNHPFVLFEDELPNLYK